VCTTILQKKKSLSTTQQQYPSAIQQQERASMLRYTYTNFMFHNYKNL